MKQQSGEGADIKMKFPLFQSLIAPDLAGNELTQQLREHAKDAASNKQLSLVEMAKATTQDEIFKHFLLANMASIDSYVTAAKLQAQSSFALCRKVAYLSFALILAGVAVAFCELFSKSPDFDVAKITALAGILTQFISGIFFYLYNRTLEQMNRFSDKLSGMQELAICFVANSNIDNEGKRDDSTAALAKLLLSHQLAANGSASSPANATATGPASK
jgi:Cyanobacterial TRADD-N associated 2-Transmembrane domain